MIGDTTPGDLAVACPQEAIADHLAALQTIRAAWLAEMATLEDQGIDEAIPTESWETRNGGGKYLRLVYPTDRQTGQRRKVYVGADPAAIETARARVDRRRRWETLSANLAQLDRVLAETERQLTSMERELRRWRRTWGQKELPAAA